MPGTPIVATLAFLLLSSEPGISDTGRRMENLTRGIVAVKQPDHVYISWRLFGTDPEETAFHVYRSTESDTPVRVTKEPITESTNYVDREADREKRLEYFVRPVLKGRELEASRRVAVLEQNYIEIPIQPLPDYRPGDASIGDLDGDGEFEIVLHQTSRARDNSHSGVTGTPVLDAYELDGRHLWRIDLGINIREGEHYTQFLVYDLDGDGCAELACKTADGSVDGRGKVLGEKGKDWRTLEESSRSYGRVLEGPEYFTIFDGRTGAELETVDYIPGREPIDGWGGIGGNGGNDSYGNRCDRFLACVAYLDGKRPSAVMCRGVYGRTVLVAWDWREGKLTRRWVFDSGKSYPPFDDASPYSGMGGHSLSVGDVDRDGRDEIVYHSMVVDDNGKGLHTSGLRHGDSMHLSDMDPGRPGLEIFTIHENEGSTVRFRTPGAALRDAHTGKILWSHSPAVDVGAGLAADIDPRHPGYEFWGGPGGLRDTKGETIGPAPRSTAWAIWWDGDLLRELLSGSRIRKWNWEAGREETIFEVEGRGRARNPCLLGDLLGDWREELLVPGPDGRSLRLYTTTSPTRHRLPTLLHDPQYRLALAWQNVVYNKPPHPGFFLGHGMAPPPRPAIELIGRGEGSPLDTLPSWITRITHFGQRADWSHDGERLLFIEKTFGDVYEIELATRVIRPMTHHYFHEGYTRALYLSNGDILLSGARQFDAKDPWPSRSEKQAELWVLSKSLEKPPVPLGEKCSEGPAVSRRTLRIAWTQGGAFYTANIIYDGDGPKLARRKKVLDKEDLPFDCGLETQNFRPPDEKELIFSAYGYQGTEVMGLDLETGKVINYSLAPEQYDEPEGIFPDGKHTLVECDAHDPRGSQHIDLYKLALDGSGRYDRITRFNDAPGFKASNPVVSDNGRYIAFQVAKVGDPAGVGRGLLILDLTGLEKQE